MTTPEERLAELGLAVPEVAKPVAVYVPAVRSGNQVFTSGQLPMRSGELMATGKVGAGVTAEEAYACAQQCALNAIAAIKAEVGDLSLVKRVVKVVVFVASHARLHRPAGGRQRCVRAARQGVRRRRRARPFGGRGGRAAARTPPSRSRCSSRSPSSSHELGMKIPLPPVPLPDHLVEVAREFADGRRTPVEPRNAATVVLLRPSEQGPEVYYLRRQVSMEFAGGMCVFPGGGVDPRDFDADVGWAGPAPAEWAERLGSDEEMARALVCAAVRETFEESGVLLAGPSADEVVADTTGEDWEADRVALESRELAMTDFLTRRGLVLRTDLLGVLGRLADAGLRAEALPHLVLRRPAARGPAHAGRVVGVLRGGVAAGRGTRWRGPSAARC